MKLVAHYDLSCVKWKISFTTSAVVSLMYAQTCTRLISFTFSMLGRYQSNLGLDHWKAAKKVLSDLQGTKNQMLTYRKYDHLKVIDYID